MNINDLPPYCQDLPNLCSPRLGAKAIFCTNDAFAKVDRMLADAPASFDPDKYDDFGKYMDGWESQRRRNGGHDYAIIQLAAPSTLSGVNICTRWFTGNYPKGASIQAGLLPANGDINQVQWDEILPAQDLIGDGDNYFALNTNEMHPYNVIKLNIYPDGGVARLRLYGLPVFNLNNVQPDQLIETSSIMLGGRIIGFNNAHYGTVHNIIAPDQAINMGDGWETRRRREPGFDWLIIQLARPTLIKKIEVDTAFYKGNYPDSCSLNGGLHHGLNDSAIITAAMFWDEILPQQKLSASQMHRFDNINYAKAVSHIRLNIFPDGGVARLRIWGNLA